jgi:hypothetical protein
MKRYLVDVEKTYKSSNTFEVLANSKEEAITKMRKQLEDFTFTEFEEVDIEISEPYTEEGL